MKKLLGILLFLTSLTSCKDNFLDEFELYPGLEHNDITWNNTPIDQTKTNTFVSDLVLETKTHSFNTTTGSTWKVNDNIQLTLPANSYTTNSGTTVNGIIYADLFVLTKKGDYIRNLLPSITPTGFIENSKTSFFITLRTNSVTEAKLSSGSFIKIAVKDTTAEASQVLAFSETLIPFNNDNPLVWAENTSTNNGSLRIQNNLPISAYGSKKGFEINTNKTSKYLTVCKKYTPPISSNSSRVDVVMPANFTNKNTIVFALFKNNNIVIRLTPDPISKSYYFNQMPSNELIKFVSVSQIDKSIYFGTLEEVISTNGVYRLRPNDKPISLAELRSNIDSL